MLATLALLFGSLATMQAFISWMTYRETNRIRGERQARHDHPTNPQRTSR